MPVAHKQSTAWPYSLGLHLGAHRTATTTLQTTLDENEAALGEHGFRVLTPTSKARRKEFSVRNFSNQILRCCSRGVVGKLKYRRKAANILRELVGATPRDRLLISDENLLGPIYEHFDQGIYPKSRCCLVETGRSLGRVPEVAFLTVRDYASFFQSAYAMLALYDPNFFPSEDEVARHDWTSFSRGWDAVVSDIRKALPQTLLLVALFEDDPVGKNLQAMLGKEASRELEIPENKRINTAPTREAIEHALSNKQDEAYSADGTIDRFSEGEKFSLYDADIASRLSDRYRADLESIEGMPGVVFL